MSFPSPATLSALFPDTADLFARVLWAEARSQGQAGMEAVASVVINRAGHPAWWGHGLRGVLVRALVAWSAYVYLRVAGATGRY